MKRRLSLLMICVFVPVVVLAGSLLAERSFTLSIERETERAALTQSLLMDALRPQLAGQGYGQLTQSALQYQAAYAAQGIELIFCYRGTPMGGARLPNRLYDGLFTGGRCAMLDTNSRPEIYAIAEPVTQELTLLMLKDVGDLYAQRWDMRQALVWYSLGGGLLVAGLSLLLAWLFIRPLSALRSAAQGMAQDRKPSPVLPLARRDELGALARAFAAMRDAVARREESLRQEAESRQMLLDALAHEMRTPLCAILGNTRLLQTAALPKHQQAALLAAIATETKRLTDMDAQLMKLTQLPHEELECQPVNVSELLRACQERLTAQAGEVALRVEGDAEDRDTTLQGDAALLALLLDNLTVNALRASSPGQAVILRALPTGFFVQDKGMGMTQEQLSCAFEPFYKADKARARKAGGVGLGLSLCQRIAQLHGGALTLRSQPGQGTVATFTLVKPEDESVTALLHPVADSVTEAALSSCQEVIQP